MNVGLEHYLTVSVLLFALGLMGVVFRRSLLVIYMSLELMLNAANLALVAYPSLFRSAKHLSHFASSLAKISIVLSRDLFIADPPSSFLY